MGTWKKYISAGVGALVHLSGRTKDPHSFRVGGISQNFFRGRQDESKFFLEWAGLMYHSVGVWILVRIPSDASRSSQNCFWTWLDWSSFLWEWAGFVRIPLGNMRNWTNILMEQAGLVRVFSGVGGSGITDDSPAHTSNLRDCGKTIVFRLNTLYTLKQFGIFFKSVIALSFSFSPFAFLQSFTVSFL